MRVISGTARGHRLYSPKNYDARPTADRIKEAMFSSIQDIIFDSRFLDLFGGTGAIGIEALSRGAKSAIIVENNAECVEIIKKNLSHTNLCDRCVVINRSANDAINALSRAENFDFIFLDPPYNQNMIQKTLIRIMENNILCDDGTIIAEYGAEEEIISPAGLEIIKVKNYRITRMVFYKRSNVSAGEEEKP